jgi:hypothetical protein
MIYLLTSYTYRLAQKADLYAPVIDAAEICVKQLTSGISTTPACNIQIGNIVAKGYNNRTLIFNENMRLE